MKTDTERTLEILQRAGSHGIHSFLLNQEVGTIRSAARINDLKKQGYSISAIREKYGNAWGVRYFLTSEPFKQTATVKLENKYTFIGSRMVEFIPPFQEALL